MINSAKSSLKKLNEIPFFLENAPNVAHETGFQSVESDTF
jgi:hypothetical protein